MIKEYWTSGKKSFKISVENYSLSNKYIKKVILNGKEINRNYLTQDEIVNGGQLLIVASSTPVDSPNKELWVSEVK